MTAPPIHLRHSEALIWGDVVARAIGNGRIESVAIAQADAVIAALRERLPKRDPICEALIRVQPGSENVVPCLLPPGHLGVHTHVSDLGTRHWFDDDPLAVLR